MIFFAELTKHSECSPCLAGHYCADYNATIPTGNCSEGYFCPEGQIEPQSKQHICPAGNRYAELFYHHWVQQLQMCFKLWTRNSTSGFVHPSISPLFCGHKWKSGKMSILDVCHVFMCGGRGHGMWVGNERPCPPIRNDIVTWERSCIPLFYFRCPEGSSQAIPCAEGTYQDEEGKFFCKQCPKGR